MPWSLKLNPVSYKYRDTGEDEDSIPIKILTNFSKKEWEKLIDETYVALDGNVDWAGITMVDVRRSEEKLFLEIIYEVDRDEFKKVDKRHGSPHNLITDIMNKFLHGGGSPSFFDGNYEDDKSIDIFVHYSFKRL